MRYFVEVTRCDHDQYSGTTELHGVFESRGAAAKWLKKKRGCNRTRHDPFGRRIPNDIFRVICLEGNQPTEIMSVGWGE